MSHPRPRLVLLLIALLFLAPVVVAILMHSGWWNYRPAGMINHGVLVEPVVPIDYARLRFDAGPGPASEAPVGRWTILYPVSADCADRCMGDVVALRQIHRAAGRRQDQLAVALLLPAQAGASLRSRLRQVYAEFLVADDRAGALVAQLRSAAGGHLQDGQAFLVDPAGNIMMRYAAGFDPTELNEDLKRLLKWSTQDG